MAKLFPRLSLLHCHNVAHFGVNTALNAFWQRFWVQNARVTTRRPLAKCLGYSFSEEMQDILNS